MTIALRWQDVACTKCGEKITNPRDALIEHDVIRGGLKGLHTKCQSAEQMTDESIYDTGYWDGLADGAVVLELAAKETKAVSLMEAAQMLRDIALQRTKPEPAKES